MLLHFYIFCLSLLVLMLGLAVIQKKQETTIRILTLLGILQVICLVIWQGTLAFTLLITGLLALSLYELSAHYQTNRILFGLGSMIFFIVSLYHNELPVIQLALIWFAIISILTFIDRQEKIQNPRYLFAFSSCFLIPCSIFLIELMKINSSTIIMILLLLQLNDSFGYLFGKQLGKTPLFKTISPNKTLEGYLCGGIGIILGILLLHTYIPVLSAEPFYKDIIIFFCILIFGNLGDLLFSSFKRKLEIKDFSNLLPGHGGILDRFDNLFFVAPIFYLLFSYHLI